MLAVTNARVVPVAGAPLEPGTVLIADGKIAAVGPEFVLAPGTEVIDARGQWVLPGLIDANTKLGIHEDGYGQIGYDEDELHTPLAPHLRALDAVNPEDVAIAEALAAGVTTVLVGPATSGVITGQCAVLKTAGTCVDHMVLSEPAGLRVSLTGTNPMMMRGGNAPPRDRAQEVAMFRQALIRAREAMSKKARSGPGESEPSRPPQRNLRQEALQRLLKREFPARMHVINNVDIRNALLLAREFGFELVLERAAEAQLMVDEIAASGCGVVLGPLTSNRRGELKNLSLKTPGILARAGVKVALATDFPSLPVKYIRAHAALAVRGGMTPADAIRALTLSAAELLGVADRVGSLEVGKDADLVFFSGDPFCVQTRVTRVMVEGKTVCGEGRC
jgi:imidazolonepropionase-like amidohydrolase